LPAEIKKYGIVAWFSVKLRMIKGFSVDKAIILVYYTGNWISLFFRELMRWLQNYFVMEWFRNHLIIKVLCYISYLKN